jgi:hypothetical protein
MRTTRFAAALAAVTVLAIGAPASAMQQASLGGVGMAPPPDRTERAQELQERAEALFSQPKQWKRAVRMLEQSAELREATDPDAYTCLIYAGRIKAALGDMSGARLSLEKAAEQALARGAVVEAANALIDAAHAAVGERDARLAQEFMDKALLLSESPLLSMDQRTLIRNRLRV